PVELPDRKAGPAYRRDDRVRPASVAHTRVDEWALERQLAPDASGDPVRELGDLVGSPKRDSGALQPTRALAENVPRAVDEDVGHQGIVEALVERSGAEELPTHRIVLGLCHGRARGGPLQLAV